VIRLTLPIACLFALLLVAPARAEVIVMGSDLKAPADLSSSHPRDWAAWPTAYQSQPAVATTVTKQGEVAIAQLKGRIIQSSLSPDRIPPVVMHVVVMRPQPDGRAQLVVSTEDLPLPLTGDPQQVNTHDLQAGERSPRICVQPGDYVALATSGGFGNQPEGGFPEGAYADGVRFQMFSRQPVSSISLFEQPAGNDTFQVGNVERGASQPAQELLMQVVIGTREHARFFCRTKAEQAENIPNPTSTLNPAPTPPPKPPPSTPEGATLPAAKTVRIKNNAVTFTIGCSGSAACAGTLSLTNGGAKCGQGRFSIPPGQQAGVKVKLTAIARRKLRKAKGKLSARAILKTAGGSTSRLFTLKRA